ncbi:hypothetical protein [Anaerosacchariphilus polymeriproducens]|uniref:Uncharacterized protein n=1 Tax=Anaerosacchariphilus polymeriproducens TaxID=1812858 RepID=A0A371AR25_9FIRM|nr:hypothetical protein [Anaerosacchariphilus polymeriproducens]RDU22023.1 hypothetical protein DWV06_15940 [Anaerosacchariphilus polymeriproducens]
MKFASKYLKHKAWIKNEIKSEVFEPVPDFYENKLQVSKHWLKIGRVYIPKSFIIGTYELTPMFAARMTQAYHLRFVLITGEDKFSIDYAYYEFDKLEESLKVLERYLPNSIMSYYDWLFTWRYLHIKQIRENYKEMLEVYGLEYLVHNRVDVFEKFSKDGTMLLELQEGNKVDVLLEDGKMVTGKIEKVLSVHNNKKGCKVRLKENGLEGRVKKVY